MKNSKFYTVIGCLALCFSVIIGNLLIQDYVQIRKDFTEDQRFTLTENTKTVLKSLDTPVEIRFYYTAFNNNMPAELKSYAARVQDLLSEYEDGSEMIDLKILNPVANSEAEDMVLFDGLKPIATIAGERLYLGVSVSCLDKSKTLSQLLPKNENLLEYQLTRSILQTYRGEKPTVGVISSLPILGGELTMEMAQAGQRPAPAWMTFQELGEEFELRSINPLSNMIPEGLDALIIVHPPEMSPIMVNKIEGFIAQGGNALIFVDPSSIVGAGLLRKKVNFTATTSLSNLGPLFKKWGVEFNPKEAVADNQIGRRINQNDQIKALPTLLDLQKDQLNSEHVVTTKLDLVSLVFAGSLNIDNLNQSLKPEILLSSSKESQIIAAKDAFNPEQVLAQFKSDDKSKVLGVSLTGQFPTNQKVNTAESTLFIIADSDIIYDQVCVKMTKTQNGQIPSLLNDNISFFQNAVEYLTGSKELIGIRSREVTKRPFVRIQNMQADADLKFKNQVMEKVKKLEKVQAEFTKLARETEDKKIIITPEQRDALIDMRKTQATIQKEIKEANKKLYNDVNTMKRRIRFYCIGLMPLLIAAIGLVIALIKNGRCAAK